MSARPTELHLCGLAAVKARFENAPGSIVRLFFDEATSRKIAPMCKALAAAYPRPRPASRHRDTRDQ